MGLLVQGEWRDQWYDTGKTGGEFQRAESRFRGTLGSNEFPAQAGRYHLYVSLACPWAHRTLIFRKLKGLEGVVPVSVVHPHMGEHGWTFESYPESTGDRVNGKRYLYEVYTEADPGYTGRVTVPVLWDTRRRTIVNNESAEILRFFNHAFDDLTGNRLDFYPAALREGIDEINAFVYDTVNNGVYKTGFATTQQAYEKNFRILFDALEILERRLGKSPFLCGDQVTEADWRLFTTLLRFDPVYHGHFKCNLKRIADYPELSDYLRCLYQVPGIAETCNLDHIKSHYYGSHATINPNRIVPLGPALDWDRPSRRKAPGLG